MKVIISESQILNILNEITSDQRMDYLLDKVSNGGFDSLSPNEQIELRRLSGEEVEDDNEDNIESFDLPNITTYIYKEFPDGITYEIGYARWEAFVDKGLEGVDNETKISVTDGERLIDVFPFYNNESKMRILSSERKPFVVSIDKTPNNREDVEEFITNLVDVDLPKIISYVLRTS